MANEKRLIDANAFKMFLEDVRQDYLEEDTFSSDFAAKVIETVQDEYLALAPTVDAVEVVHGRWECEYETWGRLQCSNCKKEALLEKSNGDVGTILLYVTSNYCPNCGAKMDGDGNG